MSWRLPPLIALRAFESVGRTGSVRAAGEELAVSHTVISRHIKNLEARLGVALLAPSGRGLALTPAGQRYHAQVSEAFDLIGKATLALHGNAKRTLDIWCIPGLAHRCLLPLFPDLQANLPNVDILLRPTLSRPDLVHGKADIEIAYLRTPESGDGVRFEVLAKPRVFPVANPAMCARHRRVERVEDLLELPLLHEESFDQWIDWFRAVGLKELPTLNGPRLWHAHLTLEAARLGQGVAIANDLLVEKDLVDGSLMEVFPSEVCLGAYYFFAAGSRWSEPGIVAVREYLKSVLHAS